MVGSYAVTKGNTPVGEIQVRKEGLYYHFQCICRVEKEDIYRLMIHYGGHTQSLGILIPERDGFCLNRKIPIKTFSDDLPSFYIQEPEAEQKGQFVPVSVQEPFAYLAELKDAHYMKEQEVAGVWIPEK